MRLEGNAMEYNFSMAFVELKKYKRIQRAVWGKLKMWIILIDNWTVGYEFSSYVDGLYPSPFIALRTYDEKLIPYIPTSEDLLAKDWIIIDDLTYEAF